MVVQHAAHFFEPHPRVLVYPWTMLLVVVPLLFVTEPVVEGLYSLNWGGTMTAQQT